jgi:aldehyde:ferredoxin oxidoreductase
MLKRKTALVNLTDGTVKDLTVSDTLRRAYFGGRGLNMHYLLNMLEPKADPLGPKNVLIFGTGFLTGILAPNSGRFNVSAKSPESQVVGDANCGGFFAPELKYAGYERVIITGKAPEPSYIYVEDGTVEVRSADGYWGLDTQEVQKAFKRDLGMVESAVCGVAGENLVRFACVRNGVKNAAGRAGMGAVMGSKNLKAVVARGTGGIEIADPEGLLRYTEELKDYLMSSKITPILGSVGTPLLYEVSNAFGAIRTKNSQLNQWADTLDADEIEKHVEKMISCADCIVHCRHRNVQGGEGPEYTALGLVGANIGLDNADEVIRMNNICNDLGLDISSSGTYLSWATELYEKGLITKEDTGGMELEFGNFEQYSKLLYMINDREGFGDVLAEGRHAAGELNDPDGDYLITVKGLPQSDPHDVRYMKAFALGIATSSRGADHLRSRPTLEIFFKLPAEVKEQIYGTGVSPDPTSFEGKEKTVFFSDNLFATIDCMGLCKFICHGFNSPHFLSYPHFVGLINRATGWSVTEEELRNVGPRVIDTERIINIREGLVKGWDTLPKKYFDDPMPLGQAKGQHIDREQFAEALDRYYVLRGWKVDGMVPEERVSELEGIV